MITIRAPGFIPPSTGSFCMTWSPKITLKSHAVMKKAGDLSPGSDTSREKLCTLRPYLTPRM